ncbi:MAG: AEC family transporter [Planktomarina sp.]
MAILFSVIAPVFCVLGFGYLAVWKRWISEPAIDALMGFTQKFAIPCLLFQAIATLDLSANFDPALLFSFYSGAISGFLIGLLAARFIFKRAWDHCVAIGFVGLFSNSVLLGLPIMERAFGPDALAGNFAIIAMHSPFCYLIGITAMELVRADSRSIADLGPKVAKAMFRNPLVIGLSLGLIVNLSGFALPGFATDAVALMARAALPAALFGLGGILVSYRPEGDMRLILFMCVVSLLIHPSITWMTGTALHIDDAAFRSAIITAAMAPGVNAYIFANMYGVAKRVAASTVLIGTAATFFTAMGWLAALG